MIDNAIELEASIHLDGSCDLFFSNHVLEHVPNPSDVVAIARKPRPHFSLGDYRGQVLDSLTPLGNKRKEFILSRIRTLKHQLPLDRFLAKTAAEASRKLLNGSSAFTYAQNGEDVLAMSLLGWPNTGFYVDVGCNLPEKRSNTFLAYMNGFCGIGIDANSAFLPAWQKSRPRDTFVEACIGQGEQVEFYVFKEHALSSVGGEQVEGLDASQYDLVDKRSVTTVALQEILQKLGAPKVFDLLSIDVEGYDEVVLQTIDLQEYRPRLILVEAHLTNIFDLGNHKLVRRLSSDGYRLVAAQMSNLFFLREE